MTEPLTPDDVRRAAQQLRDNVSFHDPCVYGGHVLSRAAYERGWGRCGNCFQIVGEIPESDVDR